MGSEGFELVGGLEVHCQLATRSKLFCSCRADAFGCPPNSCVCPVCTGQPGALPVLNRGAVELAFRAALALGCRWEPASIFARKNYFYPDLPKGYQISQYEQPFSREGGLDIAVNDGLGGPGIKIRIHRIHLEEDAGKLLHEIGSEKLDGTLVDFNRGGAPLIEIVSEPDVRSSEQAYAYLTALKEVLVYAGVSHCDMEKGEMRCDANVSVRPKGATALGTRVEVKNLNSFKAVREAIDYEFERQAAVVLGGGRVAQETRLWDAQARRTEPMRSKEEAHDYRYFPEPDLVPLRPDAAWIERIARALPELPAARRGRYVSTFGLSPYDAGVLTGDRSLGDYFEAAAAAAPAAAAKTLVNLLTTDVLGRLNAAGFALKDCPVPPKNLARLAAMLTDGTLSSKLGKEVLGKLWEGGDPDEIVAKEGYRLVSDETQLRAWIRQALAANPKAAADLKAGKEKAAGAIVGGVMRISSGKADPALVNRLIKEEVGT